MVQERSVQWIRPEISLSELANLRWTEGWTIHRLAGHFRCGTEKIRARLTKIEKKEGRNASG